MTITFNKLPTLANPTPGETLFLVGDKGVEQTLTVAQVSQLIATRGTTGAQGPQGFAGSFGFTGSIGFTGSAGGFGPSGVIGFTGSAGSVGPLGFTGSGGTGPQGPSGYPGPQGPQGYTGSAGAFSAIGFNGSRGYTGSAGESTVGFAGSMGAQGYTGSFGFTGSAGPQGPQGLTGFTGSMGSQGPQGVIGAQGPQGLIGFTGSAGPQGPQGPQGVTGAQGPQGYTGPTGPSGPSGPSGPASGAVAGTDINFNSVGIGSGVTAPGNGGVTLNGNLNLTGTGQRIEGVLSGNPHSTRLMFQNSGGANNGTALGIIPPNGSTNAFILAYAGADPNNSASVSFGSRPLSFGIYSSGTASGVNSTTFSGLPITFTISPQGEAARIVNNGHFLIGTTTDNGTDLLQVNGSIGATRFNTTSDYRLKENVLPIINALDKVCRLKPVTFTWKKDGTPSDGFLAHELQAVLPMSATGIKDQTTSLGRPVYQHIDKASLVATLTAALQELTAKVEDLEAKLKAAGVSGF